MSYEEQKKTFATNERISNVILVFLMFVRLVDQYLPVWIFGATTPEWFAHWFAAIAYILTALIIWLNRHRLEMLNVDKHFVIILMIGGVLSLFYLPTDLRLLIGLTIGFMFWMLQNNHLYFGNSIPYPSGTGLLILISMMLAFVPVLLYAPTAKTILDIQSVVITFFQAQLAVIAFEEMLFRGALWSFLRSLGLNEKLAVLIQAFLFWIAHHRYLQLHNPYLFWVSLPISALLFGIIVWRSKSLTPSTFGHFLFNFLSLLIKKIY